MRPNIHRNAAPCGSRNREKRPRTESAQPSPALHARAIAGNVPDLDALNDADLCLPVSHNTSKLSPHDRHVDDSIPVMQHPYLDDSLFGFHVPRSAASLPTVDSINALLQQGGLTVPSTNGHGIDGRSRAKLSSYSPAITQGPIDIDEGGFSDHLVFNWSQSLLSLEETCEGIRSVNKKLSITASSDKTGHPESRLSTISLPQSDIDSNEGTHFDRNAVHKKLKDQVDTAVDDISSLRSCLTDAQHLTYLKAVKTFMCTGRHLMPTSGSSSASQQQQQRGTIIEVTEAALREQTSFLIRLRSLVVRYACLPPVAGDDGESTDANGYGMNRLSSTAMSHALQKLRIEHCRAAKFYKLLIRDGKFVREQGDPLYGLSDVRLITQIGRHHIDEIMMAAEPHMVGISSTIGLGGQSQLCKPIIDTGATVVRLANNVSIDIIQRHIKRSAAVHPVILDLPLGPQEGVRDRLTAGRTDIYDGNDNSANMGVVRLVVDALSAIFSRPITNASWSGRGSNGNINDSSSVEVHLCQSSLTAMLTSHMGERKKGFEIPVYVVSATQTSSNEDVKEESMVNDLGSDSANTEDKNIKPTRIQKVICFGKPLMVGLQMGTDGGRSTHTSDNGTTLSLINGAVREGTPSTTTVCSSIRQYPRKDAATAAMKRHISNNFMVPGANGYVPVKHRANTGEAAVVMSCRQQTRLSFRPSDLSPSGGVIRPDSTSSMELNKATNSNASELSLVIHSNVGRLFTKSGLEEVIVLGGEGVSTSTSRGPFWVKKNGVTVLRFTKVHFLNVSNKHGNNNGIRRSNSRGHSHKETNQHEVKKGQVNSCLLDEFTRFELATLLFRLQTHPDATLYLYHVCGNSDTLLCVESFTLSTFTKEIYEGWLLNAAHQVGDNRLVSPALSIARDIKVAWSLVAKIVQGVLSIVTQLQRKEDGNHSLINVPITPCDNDGPTTASLSIIEDRYVLSKAPHSTDIKLHHLPSHTLAERNNSASIIPVAISSDDLDIDDKYMSGLIEAPSVAAAKREYLPPCIWGDQNHIPYTFPTKPLHPREVAGTEMANITDSFTYLFGFPFDKIVHHGKSSSPAAVIYRDQTETVFVQRIQAPAKRKGPSVSGLRT